MGHAKHGTSALIGALLMMTPGLVRAQVCPPDHVGCHIAEVDFEHRDALFDSVMLDSGWVPASAPVQVRFAVFLGGSTEVDLGGAAVTSWPSALDVAVPGRPEAGRLALDYGLEVVAMVRIDVEVAGVRYRWSGDIPIPGGIPRDLRLAAEERFDPFVLPLSEPRPVTAWDDTDMVRVLDVDVTDSLIPIPGIGGGFRVDAIAALEGSYRTERIEISDAAADLTTEGASVIVRADPGAPELGAAKDYFVLPHGTIEYNGVITLYPTLYVEIAGRTFDLGLGEVPLNVVNLASNTDFQPAEVHVPLPDVRLEETSLAFGEVLVGGALERLLSVHNDGEAELWVGFADPSAPFTVSSPGVSIPPRSSARLAVGFAPTAPGEDSGTLILNTNDPDEPRLFVRLSGVGLGASDAGLPDAGYADGGPGFVTTGGCGCRTASPGSSKAAGLAAILLIGLTLLRRRRG